MKRHLTSAHRDTGILGAIRAREGDAGRADNREVETMTRTELTPTQQKALSTILNLRKLTKETGTITTRAQNDILRALPSVDLAAVANELAK